jgi:chromosomal replication initiation ATPase DnaA
VSTLPCDCLERRPRRAEGSCRRCGGTGLVSTEGRSWLAMVAEATARAQRGELERHVNPPQPSRFGRPNVPDGMLDARFANFRIENRSHQLAYDLAVEWVRAVVAGERRRIALIGPTGVGKSHLLYSALWRLFEDHHIRAYSRPWAYELADALRQGRSVPGRDDVPAHAVRRELYAERVVMIDEIRFTANTAFDSTELVKFATHASDNRVAVFLTSNANPLSQVMGPESADRFEILVMNGPSMR